jgi:hypothetical protein
MPSKKTKINCDINATDIFTYSPKTGQLFLGAYAMTEAEIRSIQEEIKFLEKTRIWEVWQNTVKKQAIDTGMYNSTTFEDMRTAKAFLKVLAVFQDINTVIKSWKKPKTIKIPNEPIQL